MSDNVVTAKVPFEKPQPPVDVPAEGATPSVVPAESPAVEPEALPEDAAEAAAPEAAEPEVPAEDFSSIIAPYQEELATSGELSSESLGKLAEALKAPVEMVKYTYEGMKAERQSRNAELVSVAGGNDSYTEMVNWASNVYTPEEAQAFNAALVSGTKAEALEAISSLRKKFTAVNGTPQAVVAETIKKVPAAPVAPRPPADPAMKPFDSFSELMEAQRDPRYGTDSAYTQMVYKRASVSTKI